MRVATRGTTSRARAGFPGGGGTTRGPAERAPEPQGTVAPPAKAVVMTGIETAAVALPPASAIRPASPGRWDWSRTPPSWPPPRHPAVLSIAQPRQSQRRRGRPRGLQVRRRSTIIEVPTHRVFSSSPPTWRGINPGISQGTVPGLIPASSPTACAHLVWRRESPSGSTDPARTYRGVGREIAGSRFVITAARFLPGVTRRFVQNRTLSRLAASDCSFANEGMRKSPSRTRNQGSFPFITLFQKELQRQQV